MERSIVVTLPRCGQAKAECKHAGRRWSWLASGVDGRASQSDGDVQRRSTFLRCFCVQFMVAVVCSVHWNVGFADDKPEPARSTAATTFIVVRHAERDGNQDSLTSAGVERAKLLGELGKLLNVSTIYSTNTQRTKGTVKPLTEILKLEVQLYDKANPAWIDKLRKQHDDGVVLIVGHSNTTGVIAGLLAAQEPFPIEHDEYDALFIIKADESRTSFVRLKYGPASITP